MERFCDQSYRVAGRGIATLNKRFWPDWKASGLAHRQACLATRVYGVVCDGLNSSFTEFDPSARGPAETLSTQIHIAWQIASFARVYLSATGFATCEMGIGPENRTFGGAISPISIVYFKLKIFVLEVKSDSAYLLP